MKLLAAASPLTSCSRRAFGPVHWRWRIVIAEPSSSLAARPLEVEFAVVLSRVIESIEDNPAPLLRNAVYELARIKLRREAWQKNPAINLSEVRRLMLALESAIEGVETIYSKHDELRALQSLDRLIESSEIARSNV